MYIISEVSDGLNEDMVVLIADMYLRLVGDFSIRFGMKFKYVIKKDYLATSG